MNEITGMAFAFPGEDNGRRADLAGFCFAELELAEKFFDLLREWNYGEREDKDNNIKLSFVWPKRGEGYYVCLFNNPGQRRISDRFAEIAEKRSKEKPEKEQQELVAVWTMRKSIPSGRDSVRQFLARQGPERPFFLQAFVSPDGREPRIMSSIKPILKWHYRSVNESHLRPGEVEHGLVCKPGRRYRRKSVGKTK